jgi:hypothetical protein
MIVETPLTRINLTVLFVDTIPSRIYLALLNKSGLKPKDLIYLDIRPQSKKYKVIEKFLGTKLAGFLLNIRKNKHVCSLGDELLSINGLKTKDLDSCLDVYGKKDIKKLIINGINDKKLISYFNESSDKPRTILFTGGGILKEELLNTENVKFIHVHPGLVPEIRGADCFFWSMLLRGKPGYSAFYMNKGIDTGDIITKKEFDVKLDNVKLRKSKNEELYKAILAYYDPALRIKTLIDFFYNNRDDLSDLYNLPCVEQENDQGRMYFFMHTELRDFVLENLKGVNV